MGDVARGDDAGGSTNVAVGAAAAVATINCAHAVRLRHMLQKVSKHILNPDVKEKMDGYCADAQPIEAALAWFILNECGGATPAPRVNDYKQMMRDATIIGEAGARFLTRHPSSSRHEWSCLNEQRLQPATHTVRLEQYRLREHVLLRAERMRLQMLGAHDVSLMLDHASRRLERDRLGDL